MKKLIIVLFFAACKADHNGTYINHTAGPYAITDDTLIVQDSIITNHSGFQKIRNGKMMPKEYKVQRLYELQPVFSDGQLRLEQNVYTKIK